MKIGKELFNIEKSSIIGIIEDDWDDILEQEIKTIFWAIDIFGEGRFINEDIFIRPKVSFYKLPMPLKHNRDLSYMRWENLSAYDKQVDEWIGGMYYHDEFGFKTDFLEIKRIKDTTFNIIWKGVCDIGTGKTETRVPFEIDSKISFHCFKSNVKNENDARVILESNFDSKDYMWISPSTHPDADGYYFHPKK